RLLPARLGAPMQAAPLRLRLHLGDVHAQHRDVEELLDGLADLRLVRVRVDAKRVGVVPLDLRVALLRHDRGEQHFVGMQAHEALPCTASSASCVTRTERAQTSAATSSSEGVTTTARSRLRNDLLTFCSSSPATTTSGSSLPHEPSSSTALRVDGSEKPEPSRMPSVPLAA